VCWTSSAPAAECDAAGFIWSSYAEAEVEGQAWKVILVGDAVPFYRLLVAGEAVLDFERDQWPVCWTWRT
jgi:hypothetical protein